MTPPRKPRKPREWSGWVIVNARGKACEWVYTSRKEAQAHARDFDATMGSIECPHRVIRVREVADG